MINSMRQQSNKLTAIEKDNEERKAKDAQKQQVEDTTPIINTGLLLTAGPSYGGQSYSNGIAPQNTGYRGL